MKSYECHSNLLAVVSKIKPETLFNTLESSLTFNTQYLNIVPKILSQYNNTKHSSIKMTPVEASKKKNEITVYFNLYGDMKQLSSKPKFKVGDKVRVSKYKRKVFDKDTDLIGLKIYSWSIHKPNYLQIKDLDNQEIRGSFYEPELLPAKQDVFRIEKVIWRDYKKKQARKLRKYLLKNSTIDNRLSF